MRYRKILAQAASFVFICIARFLEPPSFEHCGLRTDPIRLVVEAFQIDYSTYHDYKPFIGMADGNHCGDSLRLMQVSNPLRVL